MTDPARAVPRHALVLLVILTLVWGTNWPLFPLAMREISVWTFRALTVPLSGAMLLAVAALRGLPLAIPREHRGTLVLASAAYLVVWNVATAYAAIMIPSGQAAVLGFTMPLWSALLTWLVLGERLGGRLVVAIALGAAAVVLLTWRNLGVYADAPAGVALGVGAGLGWAIGTLLLKRRPIPVPTLVLTAWQLLVAAVPITIGALLLGDHLWFMPDATTLAVAAYIALVPMCIGNLCWFAIVGLLPANLAGLSSIMVPVVAMLSGALVHREPLGPAQWVAIACTVAALWLAMMRPRPGGAGLNPGSRRAPRRRWPSPRGRSRPRSSRYGRCPGP